MPNNLNIKPDLTSHQLAKLLLDGPDLPVMHCDNNGELFNISNIQTAVVLNEGDPAFVDFPFSEFYDPTRLLEQQTTEKSFKTWFDTMPQIKVVVISR